MSRPQDFTPGPWIVAEENCGGGRNITSPTGKRVAHTAEARAKDGTWIRTPEAEANARLIAQAPALVAALEAVTNLAALTSQLGEKAEAVVRARAVLAAVAATKEATR
jgi:hypothetical protein